MAKSKSKKLSVLLLITAILLIAVNVGSICMLSLPMYKSVTTAGSSTVTTEGKTGFEYVKDWTEKDDNGNTKLSALKETIKKYEEGNIKTESLNKINESNKHQVAIVECLIIVMAVSSVGAVLGFIALILACVKKKGLSSTFGLLSLVCVISIIVLSAIALAYYTPIAQSLDGTVAGITKSTTCISTMMLVILSSVGGALSMLTLLFSKK